MHAITVPAQLRAPKLGNKLAPKRFGRETMALKLAATILALCAGARASSSSAPLVQLDAWGNDSVRVRIAPPGGSIVDPPFSALLLPHPLQECGDMYRKLYFCLFTEAS